MSFRARSTPYPRRLSATGLALACIAPNEGTPRPKPDEGKPKPKPNEGKPNPSELELESSTVDLPKGWTESGLGNRTHLAHKGEDMIRSTFYVDTTSEGRSTVPEELAALTAKHVESSKRTFPTTKIVKEGNVAAGGYEYQLDLAKADGSKAAKYHTLRFTEGWEFAVLCTVEVLEPDLPRFDELMAACSNMKVEALAPK